MRHAKVQKRQVNVDPIYTNVMVTKLINNIMKDGKKTVAQTLVYNAFKLISQKYSNSFLSFFKAIKKSLLFIAKFSNCSFISSI